MTGDHNDVVRSKFSQHNCKCCADVFLELLTDESKLLFILECIECCRYDCVLAAVNVFTSLSSSCIILYQFCFCNICTQLADTNNIYYQNDFYRRIFLIAAAAI